MKMSLIIEKFKFSQHEMLPRTPTKNLTIKIRVTKLGISSHFNTKFTLVHVYSNISPSKYINDAV